MVVEESPTADLKRVSNFDWSWAVMNDSLMLGIVLGGFLSPLRPWGFGVPPVWKDAVISLKPVGCGFTGAGGCEDPPEGGCELEKPVGWDACSPPWKGCWCCCCCRCCWLG